MIKKVISLPGGFKRGTSEKIAEWLISQWFRNEDVAHRLAKAYSINNNIIEIGQSIIH